MIQYEYKTHYEGSHEVNEINMAEYLNKHGKQGWELVYILANPFVNELWKTANYTFVFKRQVINKK